MRNIRFAFSHPGKKNPFPRPPITLPYNFPMQESNISYRPGGRRATQLRPLTLTPGYVQTAEGSVLVSLGNTRVLTCATVEQGVPGWLRNPAGAG